MRGRRGHRRRRGRLRGRMPRFIFKIEELIELAIDLERHGDVDWLDLDGLDIDVVRAADCGKRA